VTEPETATRRHPVRGGLYGLCLGIGAAIYLIIFSLVPFDVVTSVVVAAAGVVVGILWGLFAPARKPDGPPPATVEPDPVITMEEATATADADAGAEADDQTRSTDD
jgi:hypothetical protein